MKKTTTSKTGVKQDRKKNWSSPKLIEISKIKDTGWTTGPGDDGGGSS
ncbi:MAG: hypothetical protein KJ607_14040 [Bacteroidetes bacterium]|nr:hypothetical protein [Bacteroidota bacterium]